MKDSLIVALDTDNLKQARCLVERLCPVVKIFKVGSQLFTSAGPKAIEIIHKNKAKVFLDLKFHDIPNTVAKAVEAAMAMNVFMINVHALGGKEMMQAAAKAKGKTGPLLLAVTVLTSLNREDLSHVGISKTPLQQVRRLSLLAKQCCLDGVVCSSQEITTVKKACGDNFLIVTPGIRLGDADKQDQKRVSTAEFAIRQGADYIVVGRPIAEAKDPLAAAKAILKDISHIL
jgi:orotidine-5'-phosphate decarboxylase